MIRSRQQCAIARRYFSICPDMLYVGRINCANSRRHELTPRKNTFANRSGRRYDTRRLQSIREHGVISCSSAGRRTTLQNAGNRQRTYRHYDTKFQYKANRHATILHEMIRLWLRRTRKVTLPKILQRVVARSGTLRHKFRAKLDALQYRVPLAHKIRQR